MQQSLNFRRELEPHLDVEVARPRTAATAAVPPQRALLPVGDQTPIEPYMRTLLMLAALGMAGGTRVAMAAALPTIPYEKYRLDNGLEVILAQDRSLPIVAVNIWYHVGAANEEPGRTGFAHLFEHMMFTGSKHIRRGLADELLAAAGVSDSNASTSFDRTNYFDTLPSNQLELALWTHADRMGICSTRSIRRR